MLVCFIVLVERVCGVSGEVRVVVVCVGVYVSRCVCCVVVCGGNVCVCVLERSPRWT